MCGEGERLEEKTVRLSLFLKLENYLRNLHHTAHKHTEFLFRSLITSLFLSFVHSRSFCPRRGRRVSICIFAHDKFMKLHSLARSHSNWLTIRRISILSEREKNNVMWCVCVWSGRVDDGSRSQQRPLVIHYIIYNTRYTSTVYLYIMMMGWR